MVPAMRASHAMVPIWSGGVDVKMSVEVGAAILMDKPLILVVQSGIPVPDKIVRVADRIIEVDITGAPDDWSADLAARVQAAVEELDDEGAIGG